MVTDDVVQVKLHGIVAEVDRLRDIYSTVTSTANHMVKYRKFVASGPYR